MTTPIATYTFLPWLRQGIAAHIGQTDPLGAGGPAERASIHLSLKVNGQDNFASNNVLLQGPGDVIGIHPDAIVRTEPRNWATDFQPNYLATIDFYDEDFPWRYTPASAAKVTLGGTAVNDPAQTKLRPWICLVVLEESEFTDVAASAGHLPSITLAGSASAAFPPPAQAWAWAHVHVSSDITSQGVNGLPQSIAALTSLKQTNPDIAVSRLLSPRKLKEETAYHAFVLPAFEIGRLAGLELPVTGHDALTPSWGNGQTQYPVYYRWFFRTAKRGDFEYLVNLLQPRKLDPRVGIRDMDMQAPGFGVPGMRNKPGETPVMRLEGALKSPQTNPNPAAWPPAPQPDFLKGLAALVNLQEDVLQPPGSSQSHPDPVLSPPLYGRWHALQSRLKVGVAGWVNELNQDPRLRVPAGFGTQVIQANQESYMERAWQQVGDVLAANQVIRQFQLSILASSQIYKRSFTSLTPDQKIALTAQTHTRVLKDGATLAAQVKISRLAPAGLQPAFRRLTRPRGGLMRRVTPPGSEQPAALLVQMNAENGITAAAPKQSPDRIISLEAVTRLTPVPPPAPPVIHPSPALGIKIPIQKITRLPITVGDMPPRPGFVLTEPGAALPTGIGKDGATDSPIAARFRKAFSDLSVQLALPVPDQTVGPPLDFGNATAALDQALKPARALPQRARQIVAIPPGYQYVRPAATIAPVMAHPVIDDPMYKPLAALSSELLIPNLNLIGNNTVTLLESNPRFIEAYMVGLNHEFARELLWREYPTDMRPSTFLLFWEPAEKASRDSRVDPVLRAAQMRDFKPLHEWDPATPLGTHENKQLPTGTEANAKRLVLAIRGDLLKRYPTALIYAQKAAWAPDPTGTLGSLVRVLDPGNPDQTVLEPAFKAEVLPDLRFLGFNLTIDQAKGSDKPSDNNPGYYFVIQERPGEPRFGLEILDSTATPPPPPMWEDLAWNHLGDPATIGSIDLTKAPSTAIATQPDSQVHWAANAADMAYILYRVPVMVALHAESMLP
jgi:hypothetical protein